MFTEYTTFMPWLKYHGFTVGDLPLSAETSDGEDAIIDAYRQDGEWVWKISVVQKNNRMRTTCYYKDGTVETLYE